MTGSRTPTLSVCVVNHQGAEFLEETLDAIRAVDAPIGEVLLVDNASTDGSAARAAERADVELLRLPSNRGPGAARNAALRRAAHDLVLFLDNDVAPDPDCPAILARELGRTGATLAMPRIVFADDPATVQYEGAFAHFSGLLGFENAGRAAADASQRTHEIQSIVTACFLLDRSRWGACDAFDELFFFLLEDHDLGLRARIGGHRIVSVPAAHCLHRSGTAGLSLRRIGHYTDVRIENLVRNRWMILLKDYQLRSLVVLGPVLLAFEGLQLAGAIRKGWLGRWLSAAGWLLRNSGAVLRRRRDVQRSRRVPDREILAGGPFPFADRLLAGRLEAAVGRALDRAADAWWRRARRWL